MQQDTADIQMKTVSVELSCETTSYFVILGGGGVCVCDFLDSCRGTLDVNGNVLNLSLRQAGGGGGGVREARGGEENNFHSSLKDTFNLSKQSNNEFPTTTEIISGPLKMLNGMSWCINN